MKSLGKLTGGFAIILAAIALVGVTFGLAFVLIAASTAWSAYVLTILWGWFIVPVFAVPALTIVQAAGVSLVVSFMTYQFIAFKGHEVDVRQAFVSAFTYPLTVLVIGYVIQRYFM